MREGGTLYAPVLSDVDKTLGYTKGQDLAKQQKAQDDPIYQRILTALEDQYTEQAGPISAKDLARRLGESTQKIAKAIKDSNRGEIQEYDRDKRHGKAYELRGPDWLSDDGEALADQSDAQAAAQTRWQFPTSFDDVRRAIDDALDQI